MSPINFDPKVVQRTQDLPVITMSNGAFSIFRKSMFKKINNRIGERPFYYTLSATESIEIETEEDFNLATIIARGLNENN